MLSRKAHGGVDNIVPNGSPLAFAPKFQYNIRGRYTWESGDYEAHAQLALNYADESENSIENVEQSTIPSYSTWNATIGFDKENYGVELFIDNISDERVTRCIRTRGVAVGGTADNFVTRPRSIGRRFRYDY